MKNKLLKLISMILCLVLLCTVLAGCVEDVPLKSDKSQAEDTGNDKEKPKPMTVSKSELFGEASDDISYVLIYNPKLYEETGSSYSMNTGELSEYIEPALDRAGEATFIPEVIPRSVDQNNMGFSTEGMVIGSRAGFEEDTFEPYVVGDETEFYTQDENDNRVLLEFQCVYTGKYCNIWSSAGDITNSVAKVYANKFDNDIYKQMTELFGEARFAENGRKVNILFTPLYKSTGGFSFLADALASAEAEEIGLIETNTDHAIIHINSIHASDSDNMELCISTLAHEFQHFILAGESIQANLTFPGTWINEAMSGYIEEYLYPGIQKKNGRYNDLTDSTRIRHGQSLYNFGTDATSSKFDIGVYGSVFLLSEYLANNAGENVFSNFHKHWRESAGRSSDAEALAESVSDSFYKEIDETIDYGSTIKFDSEEQEWLSKMTLDFYLSLLAYDKNDPKTFKDVEAQALLYDEINDADIEGGGRIIVALKDGEFELPEGADDGFVYVGLNKDFDIVTNYICK